MTSNPSDGTSHQVVKRYQHMIDIEKGNYTKEQVTRTYDNLAASYDQVMAEFDFNPPNIVSEAVANMLGDFEDARILDCAAATGLVGEKLIQMGYTNLDAVDGSSKMLEVAKSKGVYKNMYHDFLGTNKLDIRNDTYDCLCITAFCPGHVRGDFIDEMIRVTKPGGFVVAAMCEEYLSHEDFRDKLEPKMKQHENLGQWKWLTRKQVPDYCDEKAGIVYIFQKM